MNYPIDPEMFVQELCADGDRSPNLKEFARNYALALNNAYHAGKTGNPGYPLDPEVRWIEGCKRINESPFDLSAKHTFFDAIRVINLAYAEGVRDAKAEVA